MANLTNAESVAALAGRPTATVRQEWLDAADSDIYRHLGTRYDGSTQTYQTIGDGNEYIRLPTDVADVTSITEDGSPLTTDQYTLYAEGRLIRRKGGNLYRAYRMVGFYEGACWYDNSDYVVTYVVPTAPPEYIKRVATEYVLTILLFSEKYALHGLAVSASAQGGQAGGSLGLTYSFPPSLVRELDTIIKVGLPRRGV